MIDDSLISQLLGRPLTPKELNNFDLYIDIAKSKLSEVLCFDIELGSPSLNDTRSYVSRGYYRSLFVEPFTQLIEVKVDDEIITNYVVKQNDRLNGDWYNTIVFGIGMRKDKIVEVEAVWGFSEIPNDLAYVLAKLFDTVSRQRDKTVQQKRIEDFAVTYKDITDTQSVIDENMNIISKYSICNTNEVTHGECI